MAHVVCPRCRNFNLDRIFCRDNPPSPSSGELVAVIQNLSRNCRRARCRLCRFLSSSTLFDDAKIGDTWALYAFDFDRLTSVIERPNMEMKMSLDRMVLTTLPCDVEEESLDVTAVTTCDLLVPVADDLTAHSAISGRMIDQKRVDYDLMKSWIVDCCDNHTTCSIGPGPADPDMQVISCATGEVISYQGGQYAALSYCIGPQRPKSYRSKVVTDAIICCQSLGIPYLWVDSICINQADKMALARAISSMHLVYSAATVTIASLGRHQGHGLPGVSSIHRRKQPVLQTAKHTYVSTMHDLPTAIATSKWTTRAWCFQEAVLSQRILFFGEHQTYFLCNANVIAESITAKLHCPTLALSGIRTRKALFNSLRDADSQVWEFGSWLDQYSVRDLSFQTDILSAYRGVLNTCKHQSVWGVPLVKKENATAFGTAAALATGLSWSTSYNRYAAMHHWVASLDLDSASFGRQWPFPEHDFYSRLEYPSWSWSSCKVFRQPIMYQGPGDFRVEFENELDRYQCHQGFEVHVEDRHGIPVTIADLCKTAGPDTRVLPESSQYLHITTSTFPIKLCRVTCVPPKPFFHDEINSLRHAIHNSDQCVSQGQRQPDDSYLRKVRQQLSKVESVSNNLQKEVIARFCIRLDHPDYPSLSVESLTIEPTNDEEDVGQLDDGRFLINFDRPPTTGDAYCDVVPNKQLLGLILFLRAGGMAGANSPSSGPSSDDEGEYCVLIVEKHESHDHYQRVGLVWIDAEHCEMLHQHRQKVRIG